MRRKLLALICSAALLVASRAEAAPVCGTVAQFNADAIANGITARAGTLTFKATGIDPNVGKGVLASLVDVRTKDATGGACAGIYFKVYGPGIDLGKVKDELYNVCCVTCDTCTTERGGTLGCETWAGEARSSVIFKAPSQTCDFEIRFGGTPNQHSYSVKCDDGSGDTGVGDNLYLLEVNRVALLEAYGGGGKIDGATVLSNQFCYEALTSSGADAGVDVGVPPSGGTTTLLAVEDVTASSAAPATVYPDVNDLSVGNDSEVYLKFVVPSTVGAVKKATLTLTVADTPSAEGHGGALYGVASNAWSESTLVWNGRPVRGARLGRVGPGVANQKLTFDVTSNVTGGATLSYAMASEATDTNGTHFFSKEASPANAPALTIEYAAPTPMTDAGATTDSGPSDSGPSADAATTADAACTSPACSGASPDDSRSAEDGDLSGGCAVAHPGVSPSWASLLALALAALLVRRAAAR